MTNLIVLLYAVTVTNWTDIAKIIPLGPGLSQPSKIQQQGTIVTNLVAELRWKDVINQVTLEELGRSGSILSREIEEARGWTLSPFTIGGGSYQGVYFGNTNTSIFTNMLYKGVYTLPKSAENDWTIVSTNVINIGH